MARSGLLTLKPEQCARRKGGSNSMVERVQGKGNTGLREGNVLLASAPSAFICIRLLGEVSRFVPQ